MKTKIEITSNVTLDEIKYKLQNELSLKDLISFVMDIGDKLGDSEEYYMGLVKKLKPWQELDSHLND